MILKKININMNFDYTNCYIITDEVTKETIVIDPAGEVEQIIEMLDVLEAKLKYILLTHCHADHIGGVNELKEKKGGKILIHRLDGENINNKDITLNDIIGIKYDFIEIDSRLNHDDSIHIGENKFRIIHTPGHTNGSICIYTNGMVFTGDTVFKGSWGRTDLPTGSFKDIINSISNKIMILPRGTIIYPGHGKSSIVKEEEKIYLSLSKSKY